MPYAIYPSIGFARLGNSPDGFFIAPETRDSVGVELMPDGSEQPITRFKDAALRMKRQAVRFRVFDTSDPAAPVEAMLPDGAIVRWTVTVANLKDAVHRPVSPSSIPIVVQLDPVRAHRAISASNSVEGPSAPTVELAGAYQGQAVGLGNLRTDAAQRLIVCAGAGLSRTLAVPPAPIGASFYNNPDWFDDVADGAVEAVIEIPGAAAVTAKSAWLITGPPDFAPPSRGVVTLYDVVRQVAIDEGWLSAPTRPFFETDVRPMIERAATLRYVDPGSAWRTISQDWGGLSDAGVTNKPLRSQTAILVRQVENALHDFELRDWQNTALDAWVAGDFAPGAAPDRGACDSLTRVALDGTLGQGFFPGIEAGINMTDPAAYDGSDFEFRFAQDAVSPGHMTALMAQPWQADFLKCDSGWWPAQRPFRVPQADGSERPWLRPSMTHARLVNDAMKLGVVSPGPGGAVFEQDRDPALGS